MPYTVVRETSEFFEQFEEATGAYSFHCGLLQNSNHKMELWLKICKADLRYAGKLASNAASSMPDSIQADYLHATAICISSDIF